MKKILILAALVLGVCGQWGSALAITVKPGVGVVRQPKGTGRQKLVRGKAGVIPAAEAAAESAAMEDLTPSESSWDPSESESSYWIPSKSDEESIAPSADEAREAYEMEMAYAREEALKKKQYGRTEAGKKAAQVQKQKAEELRREKNQAGARLAFAKGLAQMNVPKEDKEKAKALHAKVRASAGYKEMNRAADRLVPEVQKALVIHDLVFGRMNDKTGNLEMPSPVYTDSLTQVDTDALPQIMSATRLHLKVLNTIKDAGMNNSVPDFDDLYAAVQQRYDQAKEEKEHVASNSWYRAQRYATRKVKSLLTSDDLWQIGEKGLGKLAAQYHPNTTEFVLDVRNAWRESHKQKLIPKAEILAEGRAKKAEREARLAAQRAEEEAREAEAMAAEEAEIRAIQFEEAKINRLMEICGIGKGEAKAFVESRSEEEYAEAIGNCLEFATLERELEEALRR